MNDNHKVAFKEGWEAYQNGQDMMDNPHVKYSSNYVSWQDGWYEAGACDNFGIRNHALGFGINETYE